FMKSPDSRKVLVLRNYKVPVGKFKARLAISRVSSRTSPGFLSNPVARWTLTKIREVVSFEKSPARKTAITKEFKFLRWPGGFVRQLRFGAHRKKKNVRHQRRVRIACRRRALGAAASASRLHRVGRGFESLSAHQLLHPRRHCKLLI